tara:strand:- start:16 stop:300 length:285 start_codon:yes stop_codon:yes gene_type:complete
VELVLVLIMVALEYKMIIELVLMFIMLEVAVVQIPPLALVDLEAVGMDGPTVIRVILMMGQWMEMIILAVVVVDMLVNPQMQHLCSVVLVAQES